MIDIESEALIQANPAPIYLINGDEMRSCRSRCVPR
jgi:hypothetical protein